MKLFNIRFDEGNNNFVDQQNVLANNAEGAIAKAKKWATKKKLNYTVNAVTIVGSVDIK